MIEKFNRAMKYVEKNPVKAISLFKDFIRDEMDCKEAWLNIGCSYKYLGQFDKCLEALAKAADKDMPFSDGSFAEIYPEAWNNIGLVCGIKGNREGAERAFKHILYNDPLNYEALWNLAIHRLKVYCSDEGGSLAECWKLYKYRFKKNNPNTLKNNKADLKIWDGISHVGSIVVMSEQGAGDSIMFGRYLKILETYADKVWIQCRPEMDYLFDAYNVCRDTSECDATVAIPITSLGELSDTIPNGEWLAEKRIVSSGAEYLRIGCVWQGNKEHINDKQRSCSSFFFGRLRKYGELYTIGPGEKTPGFTHLEGSTWKDTIENLGKLDLVITVDTSIAHLCGSLGVPCWVMMPLYDTDFRWGFDSMGYNNVWYPSVTVIRNPNSWVNVFAKVDELLGEVVAC